MTAALTKEAAGQAEAPEGPQQWLRRLDVTPAAELLKQAAARYADLLYQGLRTSYQATVDGLRVSYQTSREALGDAADAAAESIGDATQAIGEGLEAGGEAVVGDPLTLDVEQQLRDLAWQLAGDRLGRYAERLRAFLETQPDADELAAWLVERALSDAGIWARGDSLAMRRRARRDFYARNRPPAGRWTIRPEGAKEPACAHIAGKVYDSYAEAEAALDAAWHPNCVHYVDQVRLAREDSEELERPTGPGSDEGPSEDDPGERSTPPAGRLLTPALRAALAAEEQIRGGRTETGVLIDRLGREVFRRPGTRTSVDIHNSDKAAMPGATFTHNHPSDWSFSPADVFDIAIWGQLSELRAVGPAHTYSLRPGSKGWPSVQQARAFWPSAEAAGQREATRLVREGRISPLDQRKKARNAAWGRFAERFGLIYRRE